MTRRARICWLSTLVVALGLALWGLGRQETRGPSATPGSDATTAEANDEDALLADLERELLETVHDSLGAAWYAARALGPRTPLEVRQRLDRAREGAAALAGSGLPPWAGADVKLALSTTLLESGSSADEVATNLEPRVAAAAGAARSFTLAWQLEHAALLRRSSGARMAEAEAELARLAELGLSHLEHQDGDDGLAAAFLAAALFRAAAATADQGLAPRARRAFARLLIQSRSRGADLTTSATRVEALSAFLLWQGAEGRPLDPRTRQTLTELRAAAARMAREPHDAAGASAALRALRLSRAVLGDTLGVFRQ